MNCFKQLTRIAILTSESYSIMRSNIDMILTESRNKLSDDLQTLDIALNEDENCLIEELKPIYSSVKSFYNKAYIHRYNSLIYILFSYDTPIAIYIHDFGITYTENVSQTSKRHINEFKKQFTN